MSEAVSDYPVQGLDFMRPAMIAAEQARSAWLARVDEYKALSMADQYEARQQGIGTELGALREAFSQRCCEVFGVLNAFHPELTQEQAKAG